MPIYVPDVPAESSFTLLDSVTLQDIMDASYAEMNVFSRPTETSFTGDGVQTLFQMRDYPLVPGTLVVTVDDVAVTPTSVVERTGEVSIAAPADAAVVKLTARYMRWGDLDLISIINAGVRFISRDFNPGLSVDESQSTELYVYEYELPASAKTIERVELRLDEYGQWSTYHAWETLSILGGLYVKFRRHPGIQEMRISYTRQPGVFMGKQDGLDPTYYEDLVVTTGLSIGAFDVLVKYTVWQLYLRMLNFRSRDDAAQNIREDATVTMRDLETRSSGAKVLFDLTYQQFRSEYLAGRIIQ